jgi:poly(3-hydroxybutyrate) depolymerase
MKNGGSAAPAEPQDAVPLIVIHGDQDAVVHQSNAVAAFEQARQAAVETAPDVRLTTTAEPGTSPGGRAYTRAVLQRAGQPVAELWTIHGAGHAWSGGSPDGSHTDPLGQDASEELVRFFREHPRSD